jgi:murein tripeptide amidase MpaA
MRRWTEQDDTKVNGRMHSEDAKIVDMVGEHVQTKEKNRMRGR